jgi:hypothetical protein
MPAAAAGRRPASRVEDSMHAQLLCPKCHQPIKHERLGVRLTALKAGIFDAIKTAGDVGLSCEELAQSGLWRDSPRSSPPTKNTVRSHIVQINEELDGSGWRIVGDHHRPWRWSLVRRAKA